MSADQKGRASMNVGLDILRPDLFGSLCGALKSNKLEAMPATHNSN
jgi:hypothetical protein